MQENKQELWKQAYNTRISTDEEIQTGNIYLSCDGAEVFSQSTMSVLVGGAKSRKTFAMSLLIEQLFNPDGVKFESDFTGEILYFDTEMSERRIQQVVRRFSKPEVITAIPIRQYSILDRYNIIEQGIANLRPEIVVIDGYKELVNDINDQSYSTKLTNKLLQWTTEYNCHITGVLHTNPESKKPRGALGTEMMNKCSLTAHVESRGEKSRITPLYSRDKEFNPIGFAVDITGKPILRDTQSYV